MPMTFGRWLRPAGEPVSEALDGLIQWLIQRCWRRRGVPRSVTLVLASTVILRYGAGQAGTERGRRAVADRRVRTSGMRTAPSAGLTAGRQGCRQEETIDDDRMSSALASG